MPFEPYHAKYEEWKKKWKRQRDVIDGEDAVKNGGVEYLPKLDGQNRQYLYPGSSSERSEIPVIPYADYKKRANFVNMTARTVESLTGAILRKEPSLNWPDEYEDQLKNIGVDGASFHELTDAAISSVIGIGRHGHLIDAPIDTDNGWPVIAEYDAECITNWEEQKVNGKKIVTMVVLEDEPEIILSGPDKKERKVFRRLNLGAPMPETAEEKDMSEQEFLAWLGLTVGDFSDGSIYFQEIWKEKADSGPVGSKASNDVEYIRTEIIVPSMWGRRLLRRIPFTFFNPCDTKPRPVKPPLMDLAILNLSHYRNSADYEHGLHFTGLPQPWAAGFDFGNTELFIGSSAAWVSKEPNARAGYLEFSGAGLTAIREAMEEKKREAAVLGARILEEQREGIEAAETVKLRHAGEQSVLARISMAVSEGLSQDLEWILDWIAYRNPKENGSIELNKDFNLVGISPQMLIALMQALQAGHISWDTWYWNLKRGEVIPAERTKEDEFTMIQEGGPFAGMGMKETEEEAEESEDTEEEE